METTHQHQWTKTMNESACDCGALVRWKAVRAVSIESLDPDLEYDYNECMCYEDSELEKILFSSAQGWEYHGPKS